MTKDNRIPKAFGVTSFALHILAMTFMLCDHLWGTFLGNVSVLGYIGRITFPIFAFMIVEGFVHTKSKKKYALRMLIFALISEIPFNLLTEHHLIYPFHQNVLWSFLLCIGMMSVYEKIKSRKHLITRLILFALTTLAGYLLGFIAFVDFFGHGILIVAMFYFTRTDHTAKPYQKVVMCLIQAFLLYWICCEMMQGMMIPISIFGLELEIYKQGFALLALPLIWLYNGKQGPYNKIIKYIYYGFYPAHLLILGVLITYL